MALQRETYIENPMKALRIDKVCINMGIGKSGDVLERAKRAIKELVGREPVTRAARKTLRDFGTHKGEPIGLGVTLRGRPAIETLEKLLAARDSRLPFRSFDQGGNVSFGIKEQIDIPGVRYDPEIGIFGMDVSVVLARAGFNVTRRKRAKSPVGPTHRVSREDAVKFFREKLGVEVLED